MWIALRPQAVYGRLNPAAEQHAGIYAAKAEAIGKRVFHRKRLCFTADHIETFSTFIDDQVVPLDRCTVPAGPAASEEMCQKLS